MASRRQPAPAATPVSQPKPAITLEDWEAKSPLGEIETRSVNLLKEASERAALPVKVCISVCLDTLRVVTVCREAREFSQRAVVHSGVAALSSSMTYKCQV